MMLCTKNLQSNLLFFIFANALVMFGFMGFVRKKILDAAAAPEDNNECRKYTHTKHTLQKKWNKKHYRKEIKVQYVQ